MNQLGKRFWSKVNKTDGCWEWTAYLNKQGYGRYGIGSNVYRAHRLAFEEAYGPIPEGMFVCHKCDNPSCVRPDHLFLGTNSDNLKDCSAKGRHPNANKTHCPYGHPYTEDNVYHFLHHNGSKRRMCRTCRRENNRAIALKKKAALNQLRGTPTLNKTP